MGLTVSQVRQESSCSCGRLFSNCGVSAESIMKSSSSVRTRILPPDTPGLVKFSLENSIAHISLNNGEKNVLSLGLMNELAGAIESLNGRGDVKAILLDSAQKAFSYGISLEDSRSDRVFQTLDAFNRVFVALVEVSKPLLIVVNGPAIGAGSELVAFGDMVIATPNARRAQPEVTLRVFPPFA